MFAVELIEFNATMIVSVNQFMGNGVFRCQAVIDPILAKGHSDFCIKSSGSLDVRWTRNAPDLWGFAVGFGEGIEKKFDHWTSLKELSQIFLASSLFDRLHIMFNVPGNRKDLAYVHTS